MDFIHPADEEAILRILGDVPTVIESEYMLRLRMKHRAGISGQLGLDGIISMLRFLQLSPPEVVGSQRNKTDWRQIEAGTMVTVNADGKEQSAEYMGRGAGGMLCIRFPAEDFIYEFPAFAVSLAKSDAPSDLNVESLMEEAEPLDARMAAFVEDEEPNIDIPSMENDWGAVEKGDLVVYGEDEDTYEAEFVAVGPNDFEVTIVTKSGDEMTLPEAVVSIKDE